MEKMSNSRRERSASDPSAWLLQQAGNLECCLWQGWIPLAPLHNLPAPRVPAGHQRRGHGVAHRAWLCWLCCWAQPVPCPRCPKVGAARQPWSRVRITPEPWPFLLHNARNRQNIRPASVQQRKEGKQECFCVALL